MRKTNSDSSTPPRRYQPWQRVRLKGSSEAKCYIQGFAYYHYQSGEWRYIIANKTTGVTLDVGESELEPFE